MLVNDTTATPSFIADVAGTYQVNLVVLDDKGSSSNIDIVTITVTSSNTNNAPIANAGNDQAVGVGTLVSLDGSASSDPDGDPITYNWTLTTKPSGSNAILTNPTTVTPSFTADIGGIYQADLTVTDDQGEIDTDSVIINVGLANSPQQQMQGMIKE